MLYLKKFRNHTEYEEAISQNLILPNVSLCAQENEVHYNPYVPSYQGFCKLALNDGSIVELEGSGELTTAMTNSYKSSIVSVEIGEACTSVGNYAFQYCSGLTSVTIGNSVTSIGDVAFYGCSGLTSVTIGNSVTSIGQNAFESCSNLISLAIGNSVTSIGQNAFYGCSGLTSVDIPNSVTSIGNYAFFVCSSLTSVTIGNGATSIGEAAFTGCRGLTSVTVNAETPPTLGNYAFNNTNDCPIYVPSSSVDAYKSAANWSAYSSRIQAIQ